MTPPLGARSAHTAETRGYIVCDACGHIEAADREPPKWYCTACGDSPSAWWFPLDSRTHAETHAATIARRYKEGVRA